MKSSWERTVPFFGILALLLAETLTDVVELRYAYSTRGAF